MNLSNGMSEIFSKLLRLKGPKNLSIVRQETKKIPGNLQEKKIETTS